jgi:hypothetical protein
MRGTAVRGSIRVRGEDTWFVRWENGIETYMPDEATARASAAALDLLAACRIALEHTEAEVKERARRGGIVFAGSFTDETLTTLRAAIAKAGS